jgi:hypothetical protein
MCVCVTQAMASDELFGEDQLRLDVDHLVPFRRIDVAGARPSGMGRSTSRRVNIRQAPSSGRQACDRRRHRFSTARRSRPPWWRAALDQERVLPTRLGDLDRLGGGLHWIRNAFSLPRIFSRPSKESISKSWNTWKAMYSIASRSWQVPVGPNVTRVTGERVGSAADTFKPSEPRRRSRTVPPSAPWGGRCRGRR